MNATTHPLVLETVRSSRRGAKRPSPSRPAEDLATLCSEYLALSRAFEASDDATCEDDDPAWQAVTAAEDRIYKRRPKTMADILALAKVAEFQARQPDGSMNYSDSFTGQIPARIIECLLRLGPALETISQETAR
jgi:hypothetical protein